MINLMNFIYDKEKLFPLANIKKSTKYIATC